MNKDFNAKLFLLGWFVATLGFITGEIIYNLFIK